MLVLFIAASAAVGYFAGVASQHTVTTVSTTTTTRVTTVALNEVGPFNQCGFATSCLAVNPMGLVLSLSVDTTSVMSNGSLTLYVSEFNPTAYSINLSSSDDWYVPSLPSIWVCYDGSPPYGIAVFRGYYTLQNVSSAVDVIHLVVFPACIYSGTATAFSFPPQSTFLPLGTTGIGPLSRPLQSPLQIYAIDGGTVRGTVVYSLWSSKSGVYTIAAGDEWGDLTLLHFSVVDENQTA